MTKRIFNSVDKKWLIGVVCSSFDVRVLVFDAFIGQLMYVQYCTPNVEDL